MVKQALNYLKTHGLRRAVARAARVVVPERTAAWPALRRALRGRRGLEVGGPTPIFQPRQLVPIYPVVGSMDNVNFAGRTVWEGQIGEGMTFAYDAGRRTGRQFVREAVDLAGIADVSYDFVASSHVIEHVANPVKALREWLRVLADGGALLLVVPHRDGTFDHRRPVTTMAHIEQDFAAGTGEDDLTHVPEILRLHDLAADPGAGDAEAFRDRSLKNAENRCLHHHVFDTALVVELLDRLGLRVLAVEPRRPYHIIVLAEKPAPAAVVDNSRFLGASAAYRRISPFPSDRPGRGGAGTA